VAGPLVVYKLLYETLGIGSYLPYRLLALALLVLASALLFELCRRRIGYLAALPLAILPLFLGAGAEVIASALRVPSQFALCSGLGALLALEEEGRRRDVLACVLLVIAATSHPVGLAFVAAGAVRVALRPAASRWRDAWIVAIPAVIYMLWYVAFREPSNAESASSVGDVLDFAVNSLTALWGAATGFFRPPWVHGRDYLNGFSAVAAGAFAVAVAFRLRHPRDVPASLWAALAALAFLLVAPAFAPGGIRTPTASRYLYPGVVVLLLVCGELANRVRLRGNLAIAAVTAVAMLFAISMYSNVRTLKERLSLYVASSAILKGELAALNVARQDPGFRVTSTTYLPSAPGQAGPGVGHAIAATDRFGDPALTLAELEAQPNRVRSYADLTLGRVLGIGLAAPAPDQRLVAAAEPRVEQLLEGEARTRGDCVALEPRSDPTSTPAESVAAAPPTAAVTPPPPLAELVPSAPITTVKAKRLDEVGLRIGQFVDPPSVSLGTAAIDGRLGLIQTPRGPSGLSWKLLVYSRQPVRVCGVAPRG
jgi:hypothetical protein